MYTYLPGSDVYIYPSANADDGGDLSTENNLSRITQNLVCHNYIIDRSITEDPTPAHNSFDVVYNGVGSMDFDLYSGIAVIAGRSIKVHPTLGYETLSLTDMLSAQGITGQSQLYDASAYAHYQANMRDASVMAEMSAKSLHLYLALMVDTTNNTQGDLVINGVRICQGLALILGEVSDYNPQYYIDLGYFVPTSNSTTFSGIYAFEENPYRYTYIDQSSIQGQGVRQNQIIPSYGGQTFSILMSKPNVVSGETGDVYYYLNSGDGFYFIPGGSPRMYLKNLPLELTSGRPLYLTHNLFANTELFVNNNGEVVPIKLYYEGQGNASTAAKTISHSGVTFIDGVIVKVRFANSNTASNPTLDGEPIYLQDGRVCPWYAISETTAVYEFVYDGTNSKWILLNPSSPLITCNYNYLPSSGDTLTVYWRESGGIVSGYFDTTQVTISGTASLNQWYTTSYKMLPGPSYFVNGSGNIVGNLEFMPSEGTPVTVGWAFVHHTGSADPVQDSHIYLGAPSSGYPLSFSYPI